MTDPAHWSDEAIASALETLDARVETTTIINDTVHETTSRLVHTPQERIMICREAARRLRETG